MRATVRTALPALLALAVVACGGDAPPADPSTAGAPAATTGAPAAPAAAPKPDLASLDSATLRQRATTALAENRLYAPAGDNAVEDYLALREREPGDPAVGTALLDLAPYVIIGAEQSTASADFPEAARLIDLLVKMDDEAPAVPRLRDALAKAQADAEAQAAAEAESQLAAERARMETEATAGAAPATPTAPSPVPAAAPAREAAEAAAATRPVAPRQAPATSAPPSASAPPPPPPPVTATASPVAAPRELVTRVNARFPEAALRRRLEGEVELLVNVRANGTVSDVEVVRANPPGVFDREAVLAVRRWRYAPAEAPSNARVVLQFKRPTTN